MIINQEIFQEWRNNPVTIEIFQELKNLRKKLSDSMTMGVTLCDSADETQKQTAILIGNIQGIDQLLGINYNEDEKE